MNSDERTRLTRRFNFRVTEKMYRGIERKALERGVPVRTLLKSIVADYLVEVRNEDSVRSQMG